MTDPVTADNVYLRPLKPESIEAILNSTRSTPCCPPWRTDRAEPGHRVREARHLGTARVRTIGVDTEAIDITENRSASAS